MTSTCDVTTCFTQEQVAQLLRAINPKRVGKDGKGFSHVEAYDVIAHLNRIFGFGNWSKEFVGGPPQLGFEDSEMRRRKNKQGEEYGEPYKAWTVLYEAAMSLRVRCQHGTWLGPWEDAATGEAENQPSRGAARDLALKTSVSQALKRCAKDLGDQFGLSLYAKGSTAALVRKTLVMPDAEPSQESVDSHITQQLPREDETAEPADDPRTTSQTPAVLPPAAAGPVEGGVAPVAPPSIPPDDQRLTTIANEIREMALGKPEPGYSTHRWLAHVQGVAINRGGGAAILKVPVESSLSPTQVALKVFLEECLKGAMDREREARAS